MKNYIEIAFILVALTLFPAYCWLIGFDAGHRAAIKEMEDRK